MFAGLSRGALPGRRRRSSDERRRNYTRMAQQNRRFLTFRNISKFVPAVQRDDTRCKARKKARHSSA